MTLDEAKTAIVFLRGYLAAAPPGIPVVADGEDYGVTTPAVGQFPDQDPESSDVELFFSLSDQTRFYAAWAIISAAALATGFYTVDPHAGGPLETTTDGGVAVIDRAFAAIGYVPYHSPWPWVLGGLAIVGVLVAGALAASKTYG